MSDGRDWTRQSDWTGHIFFVSAVLLSTFILIFLLSSSVSLSYFNLAVRMRKCLGKRLCMSSIFSIAILNGTCSLRAPILMCSVATKFMFDYGHFVLLLLLVLKNVGSARLRESDIQPISPKTPAPQYQPIDRKKRKAKIVEDNSKDRAA